MKNYKIRQNVYFSILILTILIILFKFSSGFLHFIQKGQWEFGLFDIIFLCFCLFCIFANAILLIFFKKGLFRKKGLFSAQVYLIESFFVSVIIFSGVIFGLLFYLFFFFIIFLLKQNQIIVGFQQLTSRMKK